MMTVCRKSLFEETRIGPVTLRNRFVRSATWEAMADSTRHPTERLVEVYRNLAKGGVGLIITSATLITPETTGLPGMLGIYDDSFIPEYRARLTLEIYDEIRARAGKDFGILIKINCSDFGEDDGVFAACRYACTRLAARGIDAIEITGGAGSVPGLEETGFEESVLRNYAAEIAREVDVPVIMVGVNRTLRVMDQLLNSTGIGYFSLSRPLIRQPDLVNLWKNDPGSETECLSCNQCRQPGGNVCPFA